MICTVVNVLLSMMRASLRPRSPTKAPFVLVVVSAAAQRDALAARKRSALIGSPLLGFEDSSLQFLNGDLVECFVATHAKGFLGRIILSQLIEMKNGRRPARLAFG